MEKLKHKAQVLEKMRSEYKQLEDVVSRVSPERMTIPGVQREWSVKDILAHIASWETLCVACINEIKRGGMPKILENMTQEDVDRLNEKTYLDHKDRPLTDVLKAFKRAHLIHVEVVEAYSEEGLMAPVVYWQWGEGLWTVVAANSFWHYEEHYEAIETWNNQF